MAIHFDETNLSSSLVGSEHGISKPEAASSKSIALAALTSFEKSSTEKLYGFPHLPFQEDIVKEILTYTANVRGGFDTICVVGIGGSALGTWALDCGLRGPHPVQAAFSVKNPRIVILDNVDPSFVGSAILSMNPKKTIVVVIAKSGATAETCSTFLILSNWLYSRIGKAAARRIAVVTSEGRGDLKTLAVREGYATFHLPENVGGRFSVLSAVGLLPAALAGFDIEALLKGAAQMNHLCWSKDLTKNLALRAALAHFLLLTKHNKPIQVAFPYSNQLWGMAFWFRQLWAESLGKAKTRAGDTVHVGQTPIAALGATDQHSQVQLYMEGPNDKVFSFWSVKKQPDVGSIPEKKLNLEGFDYLAGQNLAKLLDCERRATEAALVENNRPNCTYTLDKIDANHIGAFFQLMEFQTAFLGEMLNINAFDQEGVELGKKFTFGLMGRKGFKDYKTRFAAYEAKRK